MIPVICRVKHEPETGKYGDCLRACVASVLELDAEAVPHFAEDEPGPEIANKRLTDFLVSRKLAPFWASYDASATVDDVLSYQAIQNPEAVYLLFGRTESGGDHVVICKGGEIVHDPAWYRSPMIAPGSCGAWVVMVICRV